VIEDDHDDSNAYLSSFLTCKRELDGLKLRLLRKVDEFE
jgi:hypothetical protein